MLDPFLMRAGLAGLGVAVASGPLGTFVVWRRMSYFGEATAHAAILGVALSLGFSLPMMPAILIVALAMARAVSGLTGRGHAMDTLLGVAAHTSLAAGLVAVALLPEVRLDPMAYLFGDILAVTTGDVVMIWIGALLVLALMAWRWQALLTSTISPDLAYASGLDPRREDLILTLALAVVVAVAIKVVGVLLIGAMLVIPAAAARPLVRTPEAMAIGAGIVGAVAAIGGLAWAFVLDTPTGPTIVCTAAAIFALALGLGQIRRT